MRARLVKRMDWFKFLLNNTREELRETAASIYQNKKYFRIIRPSSDMFIEKHFIKNWLNFPRAKTTYINGYLYLILDLL